MTLQVRRYSWPRLLLVVPEIVLSTALSIVVENCAVFAMWFGRWDQVGETSQLGFVRPCQWVSFVHFKYKAKS